MFFKKTKTLFKNPFQLGMVLMLLFVFNNMQAQEINYKSQSLYIYKYTRFISWPEINQKGDFIIGVYGNSPIFEELVSMALLKKAANGQQIVVKHIKKIDEISNIHLLYVAASKSREIRTISEKIGNKPILVVAERGGLARKGAGINFIIMENDILKFEINVSKLKLQNLIISDELLKLGFKVG